MFSLRGLEGDMSLLVIKKDRSTQEWDDRKIVKGLERASLRSKEKLSNHDIDYVVTNVKKEVKHLKDVTTDHIYKLVVHYLGKQIKTSFKIS